MKTNVSLRSKNDKRISVKVEPEKVILIPAPKHKSSVTIFIICAFIVGILVSLILTTIGTFWHVLISLLAKDVYNYTSQWIYGFLDIIIGIFFVTLFSIKKKTGLIIFSVLLFIGINMILMVATQLKVFEYISEANAVFLGILFLIAIGSTFADDTPEPG